MNVALIGVTDDGRSLTGGVVGSSSAIASSTYGKRCSATFRGQSEWRP